MFQVYTQQYEFQKTRKKKKKKRGKNHKLNKMANIINCFYFSFNEFYFSSQISLEFRVFHIIFLFLH